MAELKRMAEFFAGELESAVAELEAQQSHSAKLRDVIEKQNDINKDLRNKLRMLEESIAETKKGE